MSRHHASLHRVTHRLAMHHTPPQSTSDAAVFALLRWASTLSDAGLVRSAAKTKMKHSSQVTWPTASAMAQFVAGSVLRSTRAAPPHVPTLAVRHHPQEPRRYRPHSPVPTPTPQLQVSSRVPLTRCSASATPDPRSPERRTANYRAIGTSGTLRRIRSTALRKQLASNQGVPSSVLTAAMPASVAQCRANTLPTSRCLVVLLCVPHSSAPLGLMEASAAVSSVHNLRCHAPIRVLAGCARLRNHTSVTLRAPNSIVTTAPPTAARMTTEDTQVLLSTRSLTRARLAKVQKSITRRSGWR
ncbi:hypothetical protein ERJ75_001685800 [Trypanosoma vivax]|nr:hypothetical protein ERJ75_001685800 [Trypanosoma vivax]